MGKLNEFKQRNDPATKIRRLEAELKEARGEKKLAQALQEILGTASLGLDSRELPKWVVDPNTRAGAPGVPTLFLSDLHWGEVVKAAQIGGVNSYNLATARARLAWTVQTAVFLCKILDRDMRYPGIVVPLGGDMISGNIHEELQATNELNTMPTVLDLFDHLRVGIARLADVFKQVFIPCVSGNHGRDTRKTWAKDRTQTSFDWLLYQFLARAFAQDKRIQFYVPEGTDALYRIYGTRYNLTHGDQFRAGDSIIGPLGPLMRGNQKKLARNQAVAQDYDVLLAGHWHQYIHLARLIVNGSLKGYDEFAAFNNYGFEPPIQSMWITHPDHGITYRMPVYCDPSKKAPKAAWVSWGAT